MENNKEVKIAILVAIIMITVILVLVMISNKEKKEYNEIDLKVYQNQTLKNKQRIYNECHITTDELLDINEEYKRITKISLNKKIPGAKITGKYKIMNGEDFIAFDADGSNKIFVSNENGKAIIKVNSDIFSKVKKACMPK